MSKQGISARLFALLGSLVLTGIAAYEFHEERSIDGALTLILSVLIRIENIADRSTK